jgi:hypothetical protein
MSGDIEEFLRRAAQRRQAQGQSRAPAPRQPAPPPPRPQRPLRPTMQSAQLAEVVDADIVEAEPVSGNDVSHYVAQHLNTRGFAERASHLGEGTRRSESSLEHEVEDHFRKATVKPTGRSKDTLVSEVSPEAAVSTAAIAPAPVGDELQNMFRSPKNIRLAFILGEVFMRPESRWQ